MLRVPFALLLVLSAMLLRVAGQTCEPLTNPTCSQWIPCTIPKTKEKVVLKLELTFCTVGTPIFVPPDSTLHELETITNQLINVVFALGTRDPCLAIGNQLNCLGYLRPCQVIPGTNGTLSSWRSFGRYLQFFFFLNFSPVLCSESIPFPQQPCLDLCEAYCTYSFSSLSTTTRPYATARSRFLCC